MPSRHFLFKTGLGLTCNDAHILSANGAVVGFVQDYDNTVELPPLRHVNGQGAIESVDEYFRAAECIRMSKVHNCDGARIPVSFHMNLNKWAEYVDCYKDRRLLQI